MKEYRLKILLNTSTDYLSNRNQYIEKTVVAEGLSIIGEGRVYQFWNGLVKNDREAIAFYPTKSTIIEKII